VNPGVDWRFYLQMAMGRSGVAVKVILIRHITNSQGFRWIRAEKWDVNDSKMKYRISK